MKMGVVREAMVGVVREAMVGVVKKNRGVAKRGL